MKIEFTKIDGATHRLSVTRSDGSVSSLTLDTATYFFHDLCHYCVEQELRYSRGFWGMLAAGYEPAELKGKANLLTEELRFIETIVGPVQSVAAGYLPADNFFSSTQHLDTALLRSFPLLEVVERIRELMAGWNRLSYGQTLMLHFGIGH